MKIRPDHPNARFTAPLTNCPALAQEFEKPVPISAILFGGRRPSTIPLVMQSYDFKHGIFYGSIMGSEITAATIDENIGKVRRDPFAMLPFIGYNIADYINHWVDISKESDEENLPKIFYINWFRKDNGKYLWPGFGENARVLKWILERTNNKNNYIKTPIGIIPNINDLDLSNLKISKNNLIKLFEINKNDWEKEIISIDNYYSNLYKDNLPNVLKDELKNLIKRFNF